MRNIFIDIGGWTGVSVEFFLATHPRAREFDIFTFECDRRNIEVIERKNLPITLVKKGVWSCNGKVRFYYANGGTKAGGTMYPGKKTGHVSRDKYYDVQCIDIAEFIRFFDEGDYIIMKLNCEGAEYEIIPRLAEEGLLSRVSKWYIQWHWDKIGLSREDHNRISGMIKWFPWKAQMNAKNFKEEFLKTI
jgi:FkbM family methyltransferase